MKVHWTDTAIGQLRSLHAYIGQSSQSMHRELLTV
jgi:hypothetical protein